MVVRYATMTRSLAPSDAIKQAIRRQVVAVFNDGTRGETPVRDLWKGASSLFAVRRAILDNCQRKPLAPWLHITFA